MPTLSSRAKNYHAMLNNINATLSYCFEKHKDLKISYANTLGMIAEIEFKIKKINLEIEIIEDPISRPLDVAQESPRVEKLIKSMESEVKYLEGDLLKLTGKLAICKSDLPLYEEEISDKLSRLKEIKDDLKKTLSPNNDFDQIFGKFFKQAWAIKAEYQKHDD